MKVKIFVIALLTSLFVGCDKGSSPTPPNNGGGNGGSGNGVAAFVLQGNGSSCSISSIGGTYTQGTTLTSSNTISVQVNVTTTGTWSILTNTVSGFSFSGSGTFASTGIQSVNLSGSGTPSATGMQNFTVSGGNSSCTFSVTVNSSSSGPCDTCGVIQVRGLQTLSYYYFNQTLPTTSSSLGPSWSSELGATTIQPFIEEKIYNLGRGTITTEEIGDSKDIKPSNIFSGTTDQIGSLAINDTTGRVFILQRRTDGKDMIAASGSNPAINKRIFILSKTPSGNGGRISLKNIPVPLSDIVSVIQNQQHASNPAKQTWKRNY